MSAAIRARIEEVEEAYEFMLAYAAQGRAEEGAEGARVRAFLTRFRDAAQAISGMVDSLPGSAAGAAFLARFREESRTVDSVLAIVLARADISSEVVDNANGLLALRAYLTSLFFLDKAVLPDDDAG